jgi:moderate conductance mechanosensitive channel
VYGYLEVYMNLSDFSKDIVEKFDSLPEPLTATIKIIGIIILSILIAKVGSYIIKKTFQKQKSFKFGIGSKKIDTMSTLTVSVFKYSVYIMAIVIILTNVFQLTSILAAAGIGGLAIGLGAQSLIKDIISGFFIVMEDQFVVGDLITIDNMTGTVEDLELRVTRLRNFNGDLYIVPNGEIKRVTNHTRGNKAVLVDIPVSYSTDIGKAIEIVKSICTTVMEEFDTITEEPKVLGITELGKDMINIRVMGKTLPNEQWIVERRIRLLIKEEFDKANVMFYDKNRFILKDFTT